MTKEASPPHGFWGTRTWFLAGKEMLPAGVVNRTLGGKYRNRDEKSEKF